MNTNNGGLVEEIVNSIGMKLRLIPAGSFMMGASPGDSEAQYNEHPQHRVEITKAFYIGVYEITQAQYEAVIGKNPSEFKGSGRPVESVTWYDALEFCRKLSQMTGENYRLPTEAEWEYACRAGTTTGFYWSAADADDYAWCESNCGEKIMVVGLKKPNAWGLYAMIGNVAEWCEDTYTDEYYRVSPRKDPKYTKPEVYRTVRGGSCIDPAARSSWRSILQPDSALPDISFRVVMETE